MRLSRHIRWHESCTSRVVLPAPVSHWRFHMWGIGNKYVDYGNVQYKPHGQKMHNEFYKIPKFGVNRANIEGDGAIQNLEKLK